MKGKKISRKIWVMMLAFLVALVSISSATLTITDVDIVYSGAGEYRIEFYNTTGNDSNFYLDSDENETTRLFINGTTGFVGIATITPNQTLDIIGSINVSRNANISGNVTVRTISGAGGRLTIPWLNNTFLDTIAWLNITYRHGIYFNVSVNTSDNIINGTWGIIPSKDNRTTWTTALQSIAWCNSTFLSSIAWANHTFLDSIAWVNATGGLGNIFDQDLNSTSSPDFQDLDIGRDVNITNDLDVTGNIIGANVWVPVYFFAHSNTSQRIATAGLWQNISFSEGPSINQSFTHNHVSANFNHSIVVDTAGIYEISYYVSFNTTADGVVSTSVRLNKTGTGEINGSVIGVQTRLWENTTSLSNTVIVSLSASDNISLQFVSSSTSVQLFAHGKYGDYPDSASIAIKRIA